MSITMGTSVTSDFAVTPVFTGGLWRTQINVTVAPGENMLTLRVIEASTANLAATFNGVAMTSRAQASTVARFFDLENPPVGTFMLEITNSNGNALGIVATPLANVDLGSPRRTPVTAAASVATSTVTPTTVANDLVLDVVSAQTTTITANGVQTTQLVGAQTRKIGASSRVASGTSTAMSWAISPSAGTGHIAIAYVPAGAPASSPLRPYFFL